jgi:peptidoglycan/xylan/chitin deacetylase (PgdA/CDA1 family)
LIPGLRLARNERVGAAPRDPLRRRLLNAAQAASYWSGLTRLYVRGRDSSSASILMYHSVPARVDESWIAPCNRMRPDTFERQMRFLAHHRCVLGLDDLLDRIDRGLGIPDRAVVLTFDDGYRDVLEITAPILERYQLPSILYLCTGLVGRGENQWADRLQAALRFRTRDVVKLDGLPELDLRVPGSASILYAHYHDRLLEARHQERTELLHLIEDGLGSGEPTRRQTLNWEEVRELARRHPRFELGIHTSNHIDLTAVPEHEAIEEVERSVDEFEMELGRRPRHFSFPYSRSTPTLRARLPSLGLRSAMAGDGVFEADSADFFNISRFEAPPSPTQLRLWTSGAHPGLSLAIFGRA